MASSASILVTPMPLGKKKASLLEGCPQKIYYAFGAEESVLIREVSSIQRCTWKTIRGTVVPLLKDPSHKRPPPVTDHYYLARMHLPYITSLGRPPPFRDQITLDLKVVSQ